MRLRRASIRTRMVLLVLVPLVALIAIYGYAVVGQFGTAVGLANASKVGGATITPVAGAEVALSAERTGAVLYLGTHSGQALAAYRRDEAATDHELRVVETITKSGPVAAGASQQERAAAAAFIRDDQSELPALRDEVTGGGVGTTGAINDYSAIMAEGIRVAEQSLQTSYMTQSLATTAREEVALYEADMIALEEGDLYAADVMTGQMPASDRTEFVELVSLRRYLVQDAVPQLDGEASGLLRKEVPASLTAALTSDENAIISAPATSATPAVSLAQWQGTVGTYASHMQVVLTKSPTWIEAQVASSARRALTILIGAAILGLLAVIASILFSLLMGRRLLRRLNGLRQSALELAHDRLPDVMARLRDGQTVDVAAEVPPAEPGVDEIDQVRQAFNTVHRAAVEAAVHEANMRRGVSEVFRNLARRSQVLLHRQLGLLDGMERRAEEPEQLEDLFRIDHLTTRMRRHAEGLIVLSGDSPGRGWRQPVPFIDVVRAAVSEVEDYTRVRVEVRTKAALAGPAVADVVHMLAELIENATVFSPPSTVVRVQGELVGRGFSVEIEDRGLGVAEDRLAEINRDLADPPAFDMAGSDRLGLFVAGRLAQRHGIKVALRSSVYGGITAVVIIPMSVVVSEETELPSAPADGHTLQPTAAVAALNSGTGRPGHNGHAADGHARSRHAAPGHANAAHADGGHGPGGHPGGGHAGRRHRGNQVEEGWFSRPTVAATHAAESIPAAQAIGGVAELVPGSGPQPAPAYQQEDGLPVRVRQASLAPELRERTASDSGAFQAPPASADAVRSTMSAMQRGWERGRSAATGQSADAGAEYLPAGQDPYADGRE